MSGGGGSPDVVTPKDPSPTPLPIEGREESEAKKKVASRSRGGRESTRFAGLLNSKRQDNSVLNVGKKTLG